VRKTGKRNSRGTEGFFHSEILRSGQANSKRQTAERGKVGRTANLGFDRTGGGGELNNWGVRAWKRGTCVKNHPPAIFEKPGDNFEGGGSQLNIKRRNTRTLTNSQPATVKRSEEAMKRGGGKSLSLTYLVAKI